MDSIAELIAHPEQLNKDTLHGLRELVAKYPYYQAARILFLQNLFLLHDPLFGEELRRAAIYLPDRKVLFKMVEGSNYEIRPVPQSKTKSFKEDESHDRTRTLIDKFLHNGELSEPSRDPRRPLTVADATTDYAAYLLQMEDAEVDNVLDETNNRSREPLTILSKTHLQELLLRTRRKANRKKRRRKRTAARARRTVT